MTYFKWFQPLSTFRFGHSNFGSPDIFYELHQLSLYFHPDFQGTLKSWVICLARSMILMTASKVGVF